MVSRIWGEEYRQTQVCIDSFEDGVPVGRFYNPYLPEGCAFHSTVQFLREMEKVLDMMEFPKSFTCTRSFAPQPPGLPAIPGAGECSGKLATFAIRILFRQNVGWQGSVVWVEGKQEQSFRSVLELILLMSDALSCREVS